MIHKVVFYFSFCLCLSLTHTRITYTLTAHMHTNTCMCAHPQTWKQMICMIKGLTQDHTPLSRCRSNPRQQKTGVKTCTQHTRPHYFQLPKVDTTQIPEQITVKAYCRIVVYHKKKGSVDSCSKVDGSENTMLKEKCHWATVAHAFDPNTQEAETSLDHRIGS